MLDYRSVHEILTECSGLVEPGTAEPQPAAGTKQSPTGALHKGGMILCLPPPPIPCHLCGDPSRHCPSFPVFPHFRFLRTPPLATARYNLCGAWPQDLHRPAGCLIGGARVRLVWHNEFILVAFLLPAVGPGAPSSFLFLVARPGTPSSVLAPSSGVLCY